MSRRYGVTRSIWHDLRHPHVRSPPRRRLLFPYRRADPAHHIAFLTDLLTRINKEAAPDAHVLLLATLAHAKLLFGDVEGTRGDIDAAWAVLDELTGVESTVNAAYYGVAADYYKVRRARVLSRRRTGRADADLFVLFCVVRCSSRLASWLDSIGFVGVFGL